MKTKIGIFLLCFLAVFAGIVMADYAPRPHVDQDLYDQRLPRQLVLIGDEQPVIWYQTDGGQWYWFSIRGSPSMVTDVNYLWPIDQGDANSVLFTPGGSNPVQLVWATVDANLIDINDTDPNIVVFELPTKTPWNVMFADVNGFPLTDDPNNFTYYEPNTAFGIGLDNIAEGIYANNYIQVHYLLNFDPDLLNTSIGWARDDVLDGPNNVRIGDGSGGVMETAYSTSLGGKDSGRYLIDPNLDTGFGYNVIGANRSIGGQYPTLRPTTEQADPGLPHTTAVSSLADLANMNDDLNGNYYLTQNIDASYTSDPGFTPWHPAYWGFGFMPIGSGNIWGPFTGTFDGCGYTISNLYISQGAGGAAGLFAYVEGDFAVANLTLSDINYVCGDGVGAIVGHASVTNSDILIQNCHSSGNIANYSATGDSVFGGIIGQAGGNATYQVNIYDCSTSVDIDMSLASASQHVGGFAGWLGWADVSNNYATGSITRGEVSQRFGGFAGAISTGAKVEYNYATGDVQGTSNVGGFVGYALNTGSLGDMYIRKCYCTGSVTIGGGTPVAAGGFFGRIEDDNAEITDCYAWGDVINPSYDKIGGFGGDSDDSPNITNVYSIGLVTGNTYVGGLLGNIVAGGDPDFTETFWDTETSGQATSARGTGHTTEWMQTKSNFVDAGWDMDNIWIMESHPDVDRVAAFGAYAAGMVGDGADGGLYLGTYSGAYNESDPNVLYIDNLDRGTYEAGKVHSMMYGYFAEDANDQSLNINADVNIPKSLDVNSLEVDDLTVTDLTDNSLIYPASGVLTSLGVAANGKIPIGSTGTTPVLAEITGTANQVTSTAGAGSITLSTPQNIHTGASNFTIAGLTVSDLTQGSVIFAGANGAISQDNSNLFWDATNNRLGIGINSGLFPATGMTISGEMDVLHTAIESDDHAIEIDVDAAGYGDVKVIDIDYITGGISAGKDEGVILININEIAATGGDVFGLEVLATEGSAGIYGMKVGAVIGPIHQNSGTFINPDIGTNDTPQTPVANMIDGDSGPTKRTSIFIALDDYIIIGSTAVFEEIEFIITTGSSGAGIKPKFEYSTGGSGFTEFFPVDGTNGFRNTGVVAWDASDLTSHAINADTGGANTYDIRITRERTNLSTSPILGYAKTAATTEYIWDKNGDVNIRNLSISTNIELGHASDTTITRASAGELNIEGNIIYRAGGTDVPFGDGGSGQSTQQAAIDALTAVSGATNEHILTKDTGSGNAIWKAAGGGVAAHAILDGNVHTDSVADAVTRGSIIYGNATPKWDELAVGVADTFLGSDGTDASYRTGAQVIASLSGEAAAAFSLNSQNLTSVGTIGSAAITASGLITGNAGIYALNGATAAGFVRIYEDSDDGGNFTHLQTIAQGGDITLTLPPDDGDAGEQLQTNGAGVLTWESAGGGGTDVKAGVDVGATADYVGAASNDGFLRTDSPLTYADGGNFITIDLPLLKDIVAGTGLSGGENDVLVGADADTTINLDINSLTAQTEPNTSTDYIAYYDAGATAHRKVLFDNFHRYVDRGDPASDDWTTGNFTTDGTWRDLDCSGIVPAGATCILFTVVIEDGSVSQYFALRKNGNSNSSASNFIRTQVSNIAVDGVFSVACDSNRVVEYLGSNTTFTTIFLTVLGWSLN